ncbi:hypothetical protein O4J56_08495 [Nocardiopsis sp. RSe5-2]|uniref:Uncharacterized protein n=1 Tax=Nocardiopsis endophytica TaxID=3018445 RepID=A0ABT4U145_9ACTN|nr:hypothetical protein [Nocardiopsis endophytica]MDA2810671.1 hypothetical protein [Nocardiopsis endophytica]
MTTLRQARLAKDLVRRWLGADPRVQGVGISADSEAGFAVEVRLERPLDEAPPERQPVEEPEDGPDEVVLRWRVVGRIEPREQDPGQG